MNPLWQFDRAYQKNGEIVIGIDEAGRGPLAGPVVAAAVILSEYLEIFDEVNDSKKLTEKKRELLFPHILKHAKVGIGIASVEEIDKYNILQATFIAMKRAVDKIYTGEELLLIDGNKTLPKCDYSQEAVVKGDSKSLHIAAASIVAKVARDHIMVSLAKEYPEYGIEKHKGYGTKVHCEAIDKYGITSIHRTTFLKKLLGEAVCQKEMLARLESQRLFSI
ncbi:MAG: ribonuclease HII [Fusobacteria bacterium]|nr:ribonuclease HII [Fusobacteriota bacterium]